MYDGLCHDTMFRYIKKLLSTLLIKIEQLSAIINVTIWRFNYLYARFSINLIGFWVLNDNFCRFFVVSLICLFGEANKMKKIKLRDAQDVHKTSFVNNA